VNLLGIAVTLGLVFAAGPAALAQTECGSAAAEAEDVWESSPALEQCAAGGDADAQAILGMMYWGASGWASCDDESCIVSDPVSRLPGGLTVAELRREGRRLLESAAGKGQPAAQNELGLAAFEGWHGVEQDFSVAREWLERSTAAGDAIAPLNLARMHFGGFGVPMSEAEGERHLRMSALRGYKPAYCSLISYLEDKGRVEATILLWTSLFAVSCSPEEIVPELFVR
jgi:TPR repeat protein